MGTLYTKDTYLNKSIEYLCNEEIYEYDISSAGYNISMYYNLLPQEMVDKLANMEDKHKRHVAIGIYQRGNKEYRDNLKQKFVETRKMFFEANELRDEDILSIKKDAIFTFKPCNITQFENINFSLKNFYTSYYYLSKYEFYYSKDTLDIKGISDVHLLRHKDYMLDFLHELFKSMELSTKIKRSIKYLMEFRDYYVNKDLDVGYYRELNDKSLFLTMDSDGEYIYTPEAVNKSNIIPAFNYINYIMPLSQILH